MGEPPKKYNCPLLGQPPLKIKVFLPPHRIQNFQNPAPPLTLGAGAHYDNIGYMATCALGTQCTVLLCYSNEFITFFVH